MDSNDLHFPAPFVERGTLKMKQCFKDKSLKVTSLKLFSGTKIQIMPLKDNIYYYQEDGMDCIFSVNDETFPENDGTCFCSAGNTLSLENTTDKIIKVLAIQYPVK